LASYNKFNAFVNNLADGAFNFASDTLKILLTNTLPVATNSVYGDISAGEVANGGGYTTGGATCMLVSSSQTSGTYKLVISAASPTWTGSGSGMGPFRYVVLYDSSNTSVVNKGLIGWWDYGSSISLNSGDQFTVAFDGTNGVLQLA
jgi:hypothetical protein